MIPVSSGARVWPVTGLTDMRKGVAVVSQRGACKFH